MKKVASLFIFSLLSFFALLTMENRSGTVLATNGVSPTPMYDPLVEPIVPENPSEYELGRNWYWHYCMPCHGDKGQGLTDEWRAVWEPDHQDCWGKGCHAGKRIEDSFAIPTVVPSIVGSMKLAQFSSYQALDGYLKSTHPPQEPGCLDDEQYGAIALYLFNENDRPLVDPTLASTITPAYTNTPFPERPPDETLPSKSNPIAYVGLSLLLLIVLIWGIRKIR